ncbi:sensor histidine kinase [Salinispora oceanensis]|uniref:hypothetical protein n=1 Tax=Salinispora oceanensis TaxID=1050199 RepID=UPI000361A3BD|nr:hypothetical protein [Salinispora oceanensis]
MRGRRERGQLHLEVGDDGRGGAALVPGGGLEGIRRRLAAFDGSLAVRESAGGSTNLIVELPIAGAQLPR